MKIFYIRSVKRATSKPWAIIVRPILNVKYAEMCFSKAHLMKGREKGALGVPEPATQTKLAKTEANKLKPKSPLNNNI